MAVTTGRGSVRSLIIIIRPFFVASPPSCPGAHSGILLLFRPTDRPFVVGGGGRESNRKGGRDRPASPPLLSICGKKGGSSGRREGGKEEEGRLFKVSLPDLNWKRSSNLQSRRRRIKGGDQEEEEEGGAAGLPPSVHYYVRTYNNYRCAQAHAPSEKGGRKECRRHRQKGEEELIRARLFWGLRDVPRLTCAVSGALSVA